MTRILLFLMMLIYAVPSPGQVPSHRTEWTIDRTWTEADTGVVWHEWRQQTPSDPSQWTPDINRWQLPHGAVPTDDGWDRLDSKMRWL